MAKEFVSAVDEMNDHYIKIDEKIFTAQYSAASIRPYLSNWIEAMSHLKKQVSRFQSPL